LVVDPSDLVRLGSAITVQAERFAWQRVVRCEGHHEGTSFYLLSSNPGEPVAQLELHATKVGWAGLPIFSEAVLLDHRVRNKDGIWVGDDLHQAAQRLIQHALAKRSIDQDAWLTIRERSIPHPARFRELLRQTLGEDLADSLARAVEADRPQDLHRAANALRADFIARRLRSHGLAAVGRLISRAISRVGSSRRPARCGVLAVVGTPDVANGISSAVQSMFVRTEVADTRSQSSLKGIVDRAGLVLALASDIDRFPMRVWRSALVEAGPSVLVGINAVIDKFVANHELMWSASVVSQQQV
jgi:hypothetical protein